MLEEQKLWPLLPIPLKRDWCQKRLLRALRDGMSEYPPRLTQLPRWKRYPSTPCQPISISRGAALETQKARSWPPGQQDKCKPAGSLPSETLLSCPLLKEQSHLGNPEGRNNRKREAQQGSQGRGAGGKGGAVLWEGHPLLMDSSAIDEKGLGDEKAHSSSLFRGAELGWGQGISGGPQTLP